MMIGGPALAFQAAQYDALHEGPLEGEEQDQRR
jgi:hypothetical protein